MYTVLVFGAKNAEVLHVGCTSALLQAASPSLSLVEEGACVKLLTLVPISPPPSSHQLLQVTQLCAMQTHRGPLGQGCQGNQDHNQVHLNLSGDRSAASR